MSKPKIIALSGDMGHGKSTVAQHLHETFGVRRYRFAEPIKQMTALLLSAAGDEASEARRIVDHPFLKNTPVRELYGLSPRDLMRALGDMGRRINPKFWANIVITRILAEHRQNPGCVFVIDDWRYPEGEGDRLMGNDVMTYFVRVNRPGVPRAVRDHSSEGGLDDWVFDATITNHEDSLSELKRQASRVFTDVHLLAQAL